MLGIATKAGKVVSGSNAVLDAVRKNIVKLIILAEDASEKTKKEIKFTCDKFNIPLIIFGNIDLNSKSIGKKNRAIIAICDAGFANNIQKIINGGE